MKLCRDDDALMLPGCPHWCREVWRGSGIVVQVGAWRLPGGTVVEVMGIRTASAAGKLTWARLQEIKEIVWGRDSEAVEVYPRPGHLVDVAPMRWLWRVESPVGFHRGRMLSRHEAAT